MVILIVHGVEAAVGLIPVAGPIVEWLLRLVTG